MEGYAYTWHVEIAQQRVIVRNMCETFTHLGTQVLGALHEKVSSQVGQNVKSKKKIVGFTSINNSTRKMELIFIRKLFDSVITIRMSVFLH